jgi:hypothetical protein
MKECEVNHMSEKDNYNQMTMLGGPAKVVTSAQSQESSEPGIGLKSFLTNEAGGNAPKKVQLGNVGEPRKKKEKKDLGQLLKGGVHFGNNN